MAISVVSHMREQNCSVFGRGVFFGYFLDKQKVIKAVGRQAPQVAKPKIHAA
jgi:hypothetical protein